MTWTQTRHISTVDENYEREGKKEITALSMRFTQQPIWWFRLIELTFLHVISIYAFFAYIPRVKLLTIVWAFFIGISSGFGVTAGGHRLWSHRSYKTKLPLKIILIICYSMAGTNSIYSFVRDHRVHHKFTDTDADPHNSKRGFWFSHIGWLIQKNHPDVISKRAMIDMSDITNDPWLDFHSRYFKCFQVLFCIVLPTIPPIWLWNEYWWYSLCSQLVRLAIILNMTFSINSFAHMWGQKPYNKKITSTDNIVLAMSILGEGWHNFHHSFPWDYRSPELGIGVDITATMLDLFQKIGWVYDAKTTSPELIRKVMKKYGDGSRIPEVPIEYAEADELEIRQ